MTADSATLSIPDVSILVRWAATAARDSVSPEAIEVARIVRHLVPILPSQDLMRLRRLVFLAGIGGSPEDYQQPVAGFIEAWSALEVAILQEQEERRREAKECLP